MQENNTFYIYHRLIHTGRLFNINTSFCFLSDWSFKKLFGRAIKSACPLARTSKVYVDISRNKVSFENNGSYPGETWVTEN